MADNKALVWYNDPLRIQNDIIEDAINRLTNGNPIPDANNVFSFLVEQFSSISSDMTRASLDTIDGLYRKRAQTMEDLYKHMSDFDYAGLFATPSKIYLELMFDKDFLVREAESFNDIYKKVVDDQKLRLD